MPVTTHTYDPGMTNPANLVSNEVVSVVPSVDRSVFPQQGAFFAESLILEASDDNGASYTTLMPNKDYIFSPNFLAATAAAGKEVSSYVVLVRSVWTKVRLTYRVLGEYNDDLLLAIVGASTFDRSVLYNWSSLNGEIATYHPAVRDPDVLGKNWQEVLNVGLEKIRLEIAAGNAGGSFAGDLTDIYIRLGQTILKTEISDELAKPTGTAVMIPGATLKVFEFSPGKTAARLFASFLSDTNEYSMVDISAGWKGADTKTLVYGNVDSQGTPLVEYEVRETAGVYSLFANAAAAGTCTIKLLAEH